MTHAGGGGEGSVAREQVWWCYGVAPLRIQMEKPVAVLHAKVKEGKNLALSHLLCLLVLKAPK